MTAEWNRLRLRWNRRFHVWEVYRGTPPANLLLMMAPKECWGEALSFCRQMTEGLPTPTPLPLPNDERAA